MRRTTALGCALLAWLATAPAASAQTDNYPSRPITIIVPFPPGGSSDVVTRLVAQKLGDNLKANVVIDNRGGGGGVPAAIAFKQATPDGYTLFLANNGLFAIMPALTADIRFDPIKDFQPITPLFAFPSVLVVPSGSPARTAKELVALAKTKAGGLNYASQGVGSGGHILGEMFRLNSGAPMVHVPYRGAGPAVTDLAAGNVDLLFSSYVSAIGQVQAGKLRLLGWTSTTRSPAIPDVPTMAEAGFPGTELEVWQGIVAPVGTPPAIVRKLNEEFVKAAKSPEVVSKVAAQAVEMYTSTPEEFAKLIASDVNRLGKVVRDAGIKMP
jgi:tripartite-type tricarboxylate transporter receptor subunit TctC